MEPNVDVICCYGSSRQIIHDQLQSWLTQEGKHLLVLEDKCPDNLWMADPKVHTLYVNPEDEQLLLEQIAWQFPFSRFAYIDPVPSEKPRAETLFTKLQQIRAQVDLRAGQYADYGANLFHNLRTNAKQLSKSCSAKQLFGKFKSTPAVICGAGPSLELLYPVFSTLSQKAIVLAGGGAFNGLSLQRFRPDFAASVDPAPPASRLEAWKTDVPCFYQHQTCSDLIDLLQGPLLWVEGSGNCPLETWIDDQLGLSHDPFDGGWTVTNFCTALALAMGCDPIIFIGVDLQAVDSKLYASGVTAEKDRPHRQDWALSKQWLEAKAASHPNRRWINCSKGGAELAGIPYTPIEQVVDQLPPLSKKQISFTSMQIDPTSILKQVDISIIHSIELIEQLLQEAAAIFPKHPHDSGRAALLEADLRQEIAYQTLLEPAWAIWQQVIDKKTAKDKYSGFFHEMIFYKNGLKAMRSHVT